MIINRLVDVVEGSDYIPNPLVNNLSLPSPLADTPTVFKLEDLSGRVAVVPPEGESSGLGNDVRGDSQGTYAPVSGGNDTGVSGLPVTVLKKPISPLDRIYISRFNKDMSAFSGQAQPLSRVDSPVSSVNMMRGDLFTAYDLAAETGATGVGVVRSIEPVPNSVSRNPYVDSTPAAGSTYSPKSSSNFLGGTTLLQSRQAYPVQTQDGLVYYGTPQEVTGANTEIVSSNYTWLYVIAALLTIFIFLRGSL